MSDQPYGTPPDPNRSVQNRDEGGRFLADPVVAEPLAEPHTEAFNEHPEQPNAPPEPPYHEAAPVADGSVWNDGEFEEALVPMHHGNHTHWLDEGWAIWNVIEGGAVAVYRRLIPQERRDGQPVGPASP